MMMETLLNMVLLMKLVKLRLITMMLLAMRMSVMLIMMMGVEDNDVDEKYDDDSGANDVEHYEENDEHVLRERRR